MIYRLIGEQFFVLRADAVVLQGTLLQIGEKQGITAQGIALARRVFRSQSRNVARWRTIHETVPDLQKRQSPIESTNDTNDRTTDTDDANTGHRQECIRALCQ